MPRGSRPGAYETHFAAQITPDADGPSVGRGRRGPPPLHVAPDAGTSRGRPARPRPCSSSHLPDPASRPPLPHQDRTTPGELTTQGGERSPPRRRRPARCRTDALPERDAVPDLRLSTGGWVIGATVLGLAQSLSLRCLARWWNVLRSWTALTGDCSAAQGRRRSLRATTTRSIRS
jgi:hypothetical protein